MQDHTKAVASVATLQTAEDFARLVARLGRRSESIDGAQLEEFPDELRGVFRRVRRLDPKGRSCWWLVEASALDDAMARGLERFVRAESKRCISGAAVIVAVGGARLGLWVALSEEPSVGVWRGKATALDARAAEVWSALLTGNEPAAAAMRAHRLLRKREVTRIFFRKVSGSLREISASWSGLTVDDAEVRHSLSVTLLCRLMFLYFVQEKGWLDGDLGFMAATVLDPDAEDLYRSRLHPLFFEMLSVSDGHRRVSRPGVPFLNGGLFERSSSERANPELSLCDESLRSFVGEVLERFRFVGRERDDVVGIDPEMLGTVFEELMGAEQRGSSGTFYTPPRLVSECVTDAISALLRERLGEHLFVRLMDGSPISEPERATIAGHLSALRVLDPAMGSGAFLLGALEFLVGLWQRVSDDDAAVLIRRVIGSNLYGVDLSAPAVTIAELRLWLTLVAALPDSIRDVEPLPNLGHHIRQGNSLFGTSVVAQLDGIRLDASSVRRLEEASEHYAHAHGSSKVCADKERREAERALAEEMLAATVERAERDLRDFDAARGQDLFGRSRSLSVAEERDRAGLEVAVERAHAATIEARRGGHGIAFDFHIAFAPVLASGGFDAVIGNPPWVRLSKVEPTVRKRVRAAYRWMNGSGGRGFGVQPDLSIAFVERSVRLLKDGGVLSLVVPGKVFTAGYGARLRAGLRASTTPLRLRDLATGEVVHFSADAFPAVLVARKGAVRDALVRVDDGGGRSGVASVQDLAVDEDPGSPWPLLDSASMRAYRALISSVPSLGAARTIRLGIKTGANRLFVDVDSPSEFVRPALRGADINAMGAAPSSTLLFCHSPATGVALPTVHASAQEHFERNRSTLLGRADARRDDPLWKIHRVYPESLGHRVAWRDIGERLDAVYLPPVLEGGPLVLNSAYLVRVDDVRQGLRLAAWLCSIPARFSAAVTAERALGGYRRFMARNVAGVPVPLEVWAGTPELDALSQSLHRDPGDLRAWRALNAVACELLGLRREMRAAIGAHADRLSLSGEASLPW